MSNTPKIIYTHTDEAPALATRSFLPIIEAFAAPTGVLVESRDISLAGRILAAFPDYLSEQQRVVDHLADLGELAKTPHANIVKLPNVSASLPQLQAAIAELLDSGFPLPEYPEEPESEEQHGIKERYDKVKGSAVNPVLREGNSDRRAPEAVKEYARNNPHRLRAWSADSPCHVATMGAGDFRSNEQSITLAEATTVRIEHAAVDGTVTVLKDDLELLTGEVIDATFMSLTRLVAFLEEQIEEASRAGILFSLHMKATMMKVSDPIIFGHAVRVYFKNVFSQFADTLERLGVDPNNGFGDLLAKIQELPEGERKEIEAAIVTAYEQGPGLAMVDSDRGITNLHVPSDIIIDASMPVVVRDGGKMWNADGELQAVKAVIPDSSYAGLYQAVLDDCKEHGAYDPATMGSVSNVGLMAQKAEEYGSHDKTFEMRSAGVVRVIAANGAVLTEHAVETGDIWRMCQAKDAPICDWVKLAITRARATGDAAIFWLDDTRAHDAQLIAKVNRALQDHDTEGLEIHVLAPTEATQLTLERIRKGLNTISVTGNVLRDYLTDLFPILELGTSAKMLSIVPLMNGGGLFETGAGGSAPKHVQQFVQEGHLRWDSLGEFLALAESLEHLGERYANRGALILGKALGAATTQYLLQRKTPSRIVNELDNRGSHFYLAMFWAQALATQTDNTELAARFAPVAEALESNEKNILDELIAAQGAPVDLGGYYQPDEAKARAAMRPSATLNGIVGSV